MYNNIYVFLDELLCNENRIPMCIVLIYYNTLPESQK